jgi:hypothetical protein
MHYPRTPSISQQAASRNQHNPNPNPQGDECALGKGAVNTHFFDRKLPSFTSTIMVESVAREIEDNISRAALVSKEDKIQCFSRLEEEVRIYSLAKKGNIPPHSLKYLRVIISTHAKFGRVMSHGNYDPINKLHACDLLYLLYEKIMNEEGTEYMRLTLEQLDEMSTGNCSQGRTARLFQALVMLRDDLTPTSKPIH